VDNCVARRAVDAVNMITVSYGREALLNTVQTPGEVEDMLEKPNKILRGAGPNTQTMCGTILFPGGPASFVLQIH